MYGIGQALSDALEDIVHPGSIIHSDMWAGYFSLGARGWEHHMVNHDQNFVDPLTGVHTQVGYRTGIFICYNTQLCLCYSASRPCGAPSSGI